MNRYRVDFRIPEYVRSGEPEVVVKSGDNAGLPTPLPVREQTAYGMGGRRL